MRDFKKLLVWQKGIDLFIYTDKLVRKLPVAERYETCSQLRRAALSIPSNIAEGSAYHSQAQYRIYLERSLGSAFETETVLIAIDKSYPDSYAHEIAYCTSLVLEIQKMLMAFLVKLK
ncbi:four helix bundle protein [Deminuibacter soli]|uniref:Four helix bundle protein n=1 Tax=Deminuibacter soli TaxID=2291815 RepID=A0A3E1NNE3_9BACT|nr:four helix bundle protein [Deminuibacter soli]RFM29459.1 four helix bundle protein [Deminuibacter soli]